MEKPVQRNIEHFFPLLDCHACHRRIVVHARIVDEHLNGTFLQEQFDRLSRRGSDPSNVVIRAAPPSAVMFSTTCWADSGCRLACTTTAQPPPASR